MPVQVPVVVVSVDPSTAEPEITRSAVLAGADTAVTTAVCSDPALAEPSAFDAVTRTRSVKPMSPTATS